LFHPPFNFLKTHFDVVRSTPSRPSKWSCSKRFPPPKFCMHSLSPHPNYMASPHIRKLTSCDLENRDSFPESGSDFTLFTTGSRPALGTPVPYAVNTRSSFTGVKRQKHQCRGEERQNLYSHFLLTSSWHGA